VAAFDLPAVGRSNEIRIRCSGAVLGKDMTRRRFISLLGGAAVWPLAARAQQSATPAIGYLDVRGPDDSPELLRGFRQGLKDTGFIEGENVIITYRFASNQLDRLPELAADLVRRRVALINTSGGIQPATAAKQVSTSTPIVFSTAEDPVRTGLVASLAPPGGNLTGINFLSAELVGKRMELLRELVPKVARVAVLINPNGPTPEITLRDAQAAAQAMGLQMQMLRASNSREIDAAFEAIGRERPDALFVGTDPLFSSRRVQLVTLASRYGLPATFGNRWFAEIGGLMTYGSDVPDALRQAGVYAGRILKGAKPEDLPVVQSTKVELVINVQTARTLGVLVPQSLQVAADELIE
jgi:putative tryptophan/tyrosine transport system substrate-binding protein